MKSIRNLYIQQCVPPEMKDKNWDYFLTTEQHKNNTTVRFCQALVDTGWFDIVEHCFPIRGRSFLDCDRKFSAIKRRWRQKIDRIYTVREYLKLLIQSSISFEFNLVTHSNIFNFISWWIEYYKKTRESAESTNRSV